MLEGRSRVLQLFQVERLAPDREVDVILRQNHSYVKAFEKRLGPICKGWKDAEESAQFSTLMLMAEILFTQKKC